MIAKVEENCEKGKAKEIKERKLLFCFIWISIERKESESKLMIKMKKFKK